ncbi:MAG: hypothetical protein ABWX94_03540 [Candidatus Saccharimonadales bacterium]
MYVQGVQHVSGGVLPNTGDSWLLMAAGIVTAVAGVAIIVTTVAFMIAKKAHKA